MAYNNAIMSSPYHYIIKKHEGFCAHAYQDSEGFWTIGYGRLIDEKRQGGISHEEAETLLANDIAGCEKLVAALFPQFANFGLPRQQALVSMAFNLGPRGLSGFKRMRAAIAAHNWPQAAREALNSKWANQVPHRAAEIADWLKNG